MLRSRFTCSVALATTAACALLQQQQRTIAFYTEQSEALINAAKHKGYTSNVWFENDDIWMLRDSSKLKNAQESPKGTAYADKQYSATETPVEFRGLRRVELYNADQLTTKPSDCTPEPALHSSLRTKSAYGGKFQRDLTAISDRNNFRSKWWLSAREVAKRNLEVGGRRFKPNAILLQGSIKVFNADQFEDPKRIAQEPVWAVSKKIMGRDLSEVLLPLVQKNGWPTGLFVTGKQLEHFGLAHLVKPGEEPVEMAFPDRGGRDGFKKPSRLFYNLTQVKDYEKIAASLGRFPTGQPTYFSSGQAIKFEPLIKTLDALGEKGKDSWANYWVSANDLKIRSWKLQDGATGIDTSLEDSSAESAKKEPQPFTLFSVHQLTKPEELFKVAGTKVF